jgi:hypothetical protein
MPNSKESQFLDELLALKKTRKAARAASRTPSTRRRSTTKHVFSTPLPPPPPPPRAASAAAAVGAYGHSNGKTRGLAAKNQQMYLSNFMSETAPALDMYFPLGEDGPAGRGGIRHGADSSGTGNGASDTNSAWIDRVTADVFAKELPLCATAQSPDDSAAGDCPWAAWALLESAIEDSL